MAINPGLAFECDALRIGLGEITAGFFAGDFDPTVSPGQEARVGAKFLYINGTEGTWYQKVGMSDTDWTIDAPVIQSGGETLPYFEDDDGDRVSIEKVMYPWQPASLTDGDVIEVLSGGGSHTAHVVPRLAKIADASITWEGSNKDNVTMGVDLYEDGVFIEQVVEFTIVNKNTVGSYSETQLSVPISANKRLTLIANETTSTGAIISNVSILLLLRWVIVP